MSMKKVIFTVLLIVCVLTLLGGCSSRSSSAYYIIDRFYVKGEDDVLRAGVEQMTKDMSAPSAATCMILPSTMAWPSRICRTTGNALAASRAREVQQGINALEHYQ